MAVDTRPPVPRNAPPSTPKRVRNVAATVDFPQRSSTPTRSPRPASSLGLRAGTPSQQQPTKIRAAITAESRIRKKSSNLHFSPARVPNGCRSATSSPLSSPSKTATAKLLPLFPLADFESSLVDWTTVEDGDVSMEVDEEQFSLGAGSKDKVLVSVRLKPAEEEEPSAWTNERSGVVQLQQEYARAGAPNPEHHYDNVLTGSENKPIYNAAAKSHVRAAMEGYNAVVFAYGQTASGKTFTLSGSETEPGIILRAMKDVFTYIRHTSDREFLLRASYLEIYKEQIHDLLSPSSAAGAAGGLPLQDNGVVPGLREEVVMSVKGLKEVLERGEANRRTASTDWNARSSRSHSVFRLVIESREVGSDTADVPPSPSIGGVPMTPGGSRLQAKGGRSVRTSTLSLIDLAGSERATSDKERTNEGKYINQSLLTLGTVIGTLAENASKNKKDFVPFRNSKLTKLLQPSLSGNARISVVCTLNPSPASVPESTSTLQFASRVKRVHVSNAQLLLLVPPHLTATPTMQLNATRKEIVDTDALIERYRKEIEDLKARLSEREREVAAPKAKRRLSAREKMDENKAMNDLSSRIKQLTRLILTQNNVGDPEGESRPASPCKLDFDLTPFQLQEQLLSAKRTIESQANQILSLEASLSARPLLPHDAPETEKDRLIDELRKTVKELEIVTRGYEDNLGAPLRQVKEDVEKEWKPKVEALEDTLKDKSSYIEELERALEREKQMRAKVEEEKIALVGFVREIDCHINSSRAGLLTPSNSAPSPNTFRPALSPLSETQPTTSTPPSRIPTPQKKASASSLAEPAPLTKSQGRSRPSNILEEAEVEFMIGNLSLAETDASFAEVPPPASPIRLPVPVSPIRPSAATSVSVEDKENVPIAM
ncbi:Kinesin-like protein kip2 [Tulasnella sp. 408]|nr:Kinesin-like protein kip2 [Tulasnella sp. 408]